VEVGSGPDSGVGPDHCLDILVFLVIDAGDGDQGLLVSGGLADGRNGLEILRLRGDQNFDLSLERRDLRLVLAGLLRFLGYLALRLFVLGFREVQFSRDRFLVMPSTCTCSPMALNFELIAAMSSSIAPYSNA
jgi:hypothetical protein